MGCRLVDHKLREDYRKDLGGGNIVIKIEEYYNHWLENVEGIDANHPPKSLLEYHSRHKRRRMPM